MTIWASRPWPTDRCRFCSEDRQEERLTPVTCFTCIPDCWSVRLRWTKTSAEVAYFNISNGRKSDGVASHRDLGRRRVGLHPHERDFDHRRPDLLRDWVVLQGYPSRHQRRTFSVQSGLRRSDQGYEDRRRQTETGTRLVQRSRCFRTVRIRFGRRHLIVAEQRRPIDPVAQAEAVRTHGHRGTGNLIWYVWLNNLRPIIKKQGFFVF